MAQQLLAMRDAATQKDLSDTGSTSSELRTEAKFEERRTEAVNAPTDHRQQPALLPHSGGVQRLGNIYNQTIVQASND
jgi:hypothetical protein